MSTSEEAPGRAWPEVLRRWSVAHRCPVIGSLLAVWAGSMGAILLLARIHDLDLYGLLGGSYLLGFGAFAITGAVIGWHRPGHTLALWFLVIGLLPPLSNLLIAVAFGPLAGHPIEVRALLVAWSVAITSMIFPLLPLTIVLFPDGRLPSPRWRWLPWLVGLASLSGGVAAFGIGGWGGDGGQTLLMPPMGGSLVTLAAVLSPVFFVLIHLLLVASGIAAVVRFRNGDGVTRQQLKWLTLAALVLVLIGVWLAFTVGATATAGTLPGTVLSAGVALVPASVGVAIVRHGLYDIDLVLSRTLVFLTLAAFITSLYAVTVVGLGSLIGDPSNLVLTIGTTALVALLFEPVRARVQRWANRAVYGRRATPYEILTSLVNDLPSGAASDDQLEGLAGLLADGTGARHATIWVHVGGSLRAAACFPAHDPLVHAELAIPSDEELPVPDATYVEPVELDGELLGALSFERGRNAPVTPHDRELLEQMSGQASLVLGNARLRQRLRERVEELRASRQRLVAAQDEARRALERDLHDGAQQQLVALKVKLGLARSIAAKEAAGEQVAGAIGELTTVADRAVEALRDLARGIYPPLLEAEGLERALVSQLRRTQLPVELRTDSLRRYARQIEATIYFCVLEAVRNAAVHAHATNVTVLLDDGDDRIGFRVSDDGPGFDPDAVMHGSGLRTMSDRLDALGGSLAIGLGIDGGTEVTGSVPVAAVAPDDERLTELTGV